MPAPEPQTPDRDPGPTPGRFTFRRAVRLSGSKAFSAVFEAKMRKHAGPLSVLTKPNSLRFSRLGLSVSRKVGGAVRRNRVKRLIREAFRLQQHDLPAGYDIVVVVRPHDPFLPLTEYARLLRGAVEAGTTNWAKRRRPRDADSTSEKPAGGQ